ncbi:MAG: phosphodiester glycosidase family protein [Candidatus Eremiobacteraeota bacterium]|nr:phosphodiester glycosidase family protein [Candidatus Eremiobacteraeota bacterium]MCW5871705.1 phosphodiester glycosidase family protein [Candidatus Eremiobacteraeota bacterium]
MRSTLALWVLFGLPAAAEPAWRKVADGLEYRPGWVNNKPEQLLHLVRFQPHKMELRVLKPGGGLPKQRSQEFLQQSGALAVFNGGYFDPQDRVLGLLYAGHWIQSKPAGGPAFGGVFSLIGDKPGLQPIFQISETEYQGLRNAPDLRFMIQCGPRLLANGQPVSGLEKTFSRRTAIAYDEQGRLILLASAPAYALSFSQLQAYLRDQLKVKWALNLDGGSSTQCSVKGRVENPGYSPVPYALGVFAR